MANVTPRPPKSPFDFGQAISQLFQTAGGTRWALRLIIVTGLLLGLVYVVAGSIMALPYLEMVAQLDQNAQDPGEALSSIVPLIPGYVILMIGPLIVMVMAETAMHRAILRNEDTPGIPLRFGMDELRVLGASLSVWILAFLAFFGVVFLLAMIGGILSALSSGLMVVVILIAYLAGLVVWPFVAIRLSPAAALTVYNEKAHVMAGRHISKHRFWSLFLGFLFVGFIGYVINTVISMMGMMALIGSEGGMFLATGGMTEGNGGDIVQTLRDRFSNPLTLLLTFLLVMFYSCFVAAWLLSLAGVGTYAVKWWAEDDEASPFD